MEMLHPQVPEGLLLSSAKRLGVSGGTAPFFSLTLSPEHQTAGCPADFFVGKDLSRSEAEAPFYDEILAILKSADLGNDPDGLGELLKFAFQYEGIFTTQEAPTNDAPPSDDQTVDLLVLQNLRCGAGKLRLLDIKMGEKTASPGWQGKSSSAAQRQAIVDSITNSSAEGFRLEGFDGAPESLVSMNPLVDVPSAFKGLLGSEKMEKKARRIMMQRLSAADVLSHFLALSEPGVAELQEVLLHESISKLSALAVACRKVRRPGGCEGRVSAAVERGFLLLRVDVEGGQGREASLQEEGSAQRRA